MSVIVFHQEFGRSVAGHLAGVHDRLVPLDQFLEAPEVGMDHAYLISATPAYDAFRRFDRIMQRESVRWTLAFLNGHKAVCGPAFGPPPGPCFECFFRRMLSHAKNVDAAEQEIALGNFYSGDLTRGHPGFSPSAAWTMAEFLGEIEGSTTTGDMMRFDLLEVEVTRGRIIPVHACPKCRPQSGGGRRFVQHIAAIMPSGAPYGG